MTTTALDSKQAAPAATACGKVIRGFHSDWGAEASAIRSSILATARKQGQNLFDAFLTIAGPSPLQAIPARP